MASYQPAMITIQGTADEWHQIQTATATAAVQQYTQAITMNTTASAWTVDDLRDGVWLQWTNTPITSTFATNEVLYREWVAHDEDRDERRRLQAEREERRQQERRDALQRLREEENRARLRRQQEELVAAEAQKTALELFRSLLTPEQAEEWAERQVVTVRGSEGGLYIIDGTMNSIHGNVVLTDEHGCLLRRLCFATQMYEGEYYNAQVLPLADGWVGQLMAIRHNEAEVIRIANPSHVRRCMYPRERAA